MVRRSGFTLIELMVVIGLMILISSIVISGSFGMTRSASYRGAGNVVFNTLQMARQHACTDGRRVIVAFTIDSDVTYEDNALSVVEAAGTVTEGNDKGELVGSYIQDRCSHLPEGKNPGNVWNLRSGAHFKGFTVSRNKKLTKPIPGGGGQYSYGCTQINPGSGSGFKKENWKKGDPYGFQILQSQTLPRGIKIGYKSVGASPAGKLIVFEPDGTGFCDEPSKDGLKWENGDKDVTLFLYEEIFKGDEKKAVRINFNNGFVSFEKD